METETRHLVASPIPPIPGITRIETLPYDVLYEIAHYAFAEDHFNFPRRLSHASYSLRMFSLSTPTLWSHISFTDPQQKPTAFHEQRLWLERSGSTPLHIIICPKNSEPYEWPANSFGMKALVAIMKLLLPHVGRWRSFHVRYLSSLKAYRAVFDPLVDAYAAELVDLAADIPRNNTRWALKPFGSGAPKLRRIEVDQPGSLLRGGVWKGWTSLRRFVSKHDYSDGNPRHIVTPAQILHLIRINPNLEELEVKEAILHPDQPPATPSHLVEALNLRHLHISSIPSRVNVVQRSILLAIHAPNLTTVEPWLLVTGDLVPVILSTAVFPWPNLRCLVLDGSATSYSQVASLLSRFSLLEKLHLRGTATVEPLVYTLSADLPSLVELHMELRCAADFQHVRDIVAARYEDPSLASLSAMHVNARALSTWNASPETQGLREVYTWKEYQWFREHVKSFYSTVIPEEEEPDTAGRSSIGRGNWRGRGRGGGRLPPRRRYRKARQTRRAKKEARRHAVEPDLQPESPSI